MPAISLWSLALVLALVVTAGLLVYEYRRDGPWRPAMGTLVAGIATTAAFASLHADLLSGLVADGPGVVDSLADVAALALLLFSVGLAAVGGYRLLTNSDGDDEGPTRV